MGRGATPASVREWLKLEVYEVNEVRRVLRMRPAEDLAAIPGVDEAFDRPQGVDGAGEVAQAAIQLARA